MKKVIVILMGICFIGCSKPTSDDIQRKQQEDLLKEGTAQVGMPSVKNFRERKLLKDIIEKRDQEGLITYTYIENAYPVVARGITTLGGKLTFLGESIGYGLPYATQFTNPQKIEWSSMGGGHITNLPQADPNGLFSPASAEGTWVLLKDPNSKDVQVVYCEPRIIIFPFKLKFD